MSALRVGLVYAAGANFLAQCINFVQRLLLPPLFIGAWGVEGYAKWILLTSMTAYVSLAELGGTAYVSNRMTVAYTNKNWAEYRKVLNTGLAVVTFLPMVALCIGMVVLLSFDKSDTLLLQVARTSNEEIWAFLIISLQTVLAMPTGVIYRGYWSIGMQARGLMLYNLATSLQLSFTVTTLLAGGSKTMAAISLLLPFTIVSAYATWDFCKKTGCENLYSLNEIDASVARGLIRPSIKFWLISVAGLLQNQGLNIVIGTSLGTTELVIFSTTRTIANVIKQATGLFVNTAWPELTRLATLGEKAGLAKLYNVVVRFSVVSSCVLALICFYFGRELMALWLQKDYVFNKEALGLSLAIAVQSAYWSCGSGFLIAISKVNGLTIVVGLASIVSVVFAAVLGASYGLPYAFLGILMADMLLPLWWVPVQVRRYLPIVPMMSLALEMILPIFALFACIVSPWMVIPSSLVAVSWIANGLFSSKRAKAKA